MGVRRLRGMSCASQGEIIAMSDDREHKIDRPIIDTDKLQNTNRHRILMLCLELTKLSDKTRDDSVVWECSPGASRKMWMPIDKSIAKQWVLYRKDGQPPLFLRTLLSPRYIDLYQGDELVVAAPIVHSTGYHILRTLLEAVVEQTKRMTLKHSKSRNETVIQRVKHFFSKGDKT